MKNCVYRFLNKNNEIIYIGKATNLRSRISSHNHLPQKCYDEKVRIEFISFESEDEMDFAERYFIPKHKPKYNTVMSNRIMNLSLAEFDNREWISIEEYEKAQIQKRIDKWEKEKNQKRIEKQKQKEIDKKLKLIRTEIQSYINILEMKNNIKIDIDINNYSIDIENYGDFYDYIDKVAKTKIDKKNNYNYNNRKVICMGSGEIFNSLTEYREYINTNISLEILSKVANEEEHILLGIYHPKHYKLFSRPKFLDVFKKYDIEHQENLKFIMKQDTRSLICLTNGEVYSNKYDANDKTNIHYSRIINCCNNKSIYAGSLNNKPLVWKWHDEYLNMTKDEIDEYLNKALKLYSKRNRAV